MQVFGRCGIGTAPALHLGVSHEQIGLGVVVLAGETIEQHGHVQRAGAFGAGRQFDQHLLVADHVGPAVVVHVERQVSFVQHMSLGIGKPDLKARRRPVGAEIGRELQVGLPAGQDDGRADIIADGLARLAIPELQRRVVGKDPVLQLVQHRVERRFFLVRQAVDLAQGVRVKFGAVFDGNAEVRDLVFGDLAKVASGGTDIQ